MVEGAHSVLSDGYGRLANRIASSVSAGVKYGIPIMTADVNTVAAIFWAYRRPDVLVVV